MKICYSCFSKLPAGAKVCPRCGCSADLKNEEKYPHALPCGTVLNGRYIVGRVLGQGGFGITYAGQEFNSKKLVAIKEYFPDTMASREQSSHSVVPFNTDRSKGFEYGKEQFLREAQTLSAFIGSPNIVRVYSFFEENGTAYFVMEYVRGQSLRQYLQSRGGRISWEEAWKLLMPVLEALSEVHSKKIIHRDIKPDNIIMTNDGSAKLIDFGAARYNHGEKSRSLTAVLTPGFAPLEQYFSRGRQGPWTDVYALAATIYYCVTGKAPVDSVERSAEDTLQSPSAEGAVIPRYAEEALMKALAVKDKERFETTYDFRNAVLEGKRREAEQGGSTDQGTPGTSVPDENSPEDEKARQEKMLEDSFREMLEKAVQGNAAAQYQLGYYFESGMGVQKDVNLAEKWYSRAAAQGNIAAKAKMDILKPKKRKSAAADTPSAEKKGQDGNISGDVSKTSPETGRTYQRNRIGNESRKNDRKDEKAPDKPGESSTAVHAKQEQEGDKTDTEKKGSRMKILPAAVIIIIIAITVFSLSNKSTTSGGSEKQISVEKTEQSDKEEMTAGNDSEERTEEDSTQKTEKISRTSDAPMALTDTWEQIIAASKDGTYKDKYRIGDTKELDMGSEGLITMKLVAMDEDELADGSGKAPMTWVADELLNSEHNMNDEKTNKGGWEASGMRAWLRENVLPLMPEEVRRGIREVTKYSYSYEVKKDIKTEDRIWIPSEREVFLGDHDKNWLNDQTGVAYTEVFNSNESRVRSRAGASGASWWWLRSAYYIGAIFFKDVSSDGSYYTNTASREGGVVVGFCL